MRTEQTVEINSVETALRELSPLIDGVQRALETFVDAGAEGAADELGDAARGLGEIRGTLELLDLHGPAMLCGEMRDLALAVASDGISDRDSALERMLKATLRLTDYLDRIRAGRRDAPLVLLPLMNELRAARGGEPLSEREVFFPDLSRPPGIVRAHAEDDRPDMIATAGQLRPRFRRALLAWYQGRDAESNLYKLGQFLRELAEASTSPSGQRLWGICGALTEALADQGLEADNEVQRLMARVERLLSRVSHEGERALEQQLPVDLLRGLLYHVARAGSSGERVRAVREAYDLGATMGQEGDAAGFEGPDRNLLGVVADGIREDIAAIKDAIEIHVYGEDSGGDALAGIPEQLGRIGDTFSMLGLQSAHDTLQAEADMVSGIGALDAGEADQRLQALADTLLRLEGELDRLLDTRRRGDAAGVGDADVPLAGLQEMPAGEYRSLLSATIGAALEDLAKVREALAMYCSSPEGGTDAVAEVPALLDEVHGALWILPLPQADAVLCDLREYVRADLVERGVRPDDETQILIADVVAGLEYYLEAVDHDRAGMIHLLQGAERAIEALRSGGEPTTHADDESVVMQSAGDDEEDVSDLRAGTPGDAVPPADDTADVEAGGSDDDIVVDEFILDDDDTSAWRDAGSAAGDDADPEVSDFLERELAQGPGDTGEGHVDAPGDAAAAAVDDEPAAERAGDDTDAGPSDEALHDLDLDDLRDVTDELEPVEPRESPPGEPGLPELSPDLTGDDDPSASAPADAAPGAEPDDRAADPEPAADSTLAAGVDPDASGSRLAILGDDVDEDIVEVYIEEALGELDRINECLPRWRSDPADEDALITVRRAFHTLKGGGRLIGAELIAEFSWAMENMLNRVIDRSIDTTSAVFDTLDEGAAALPQLIEQIQGNRAPIDDIDDLIARAHAISRGEPGPPSGGGRPGPRNPAGPEPAGMPSAAQDPGEPGGSRGEAEADAGEPPVAPQGASGESVASVHGDTGDNGKAGSAAADREGAGSATGDDDGGSTLLDIFADEAARHLAVVREHLPDDVDQAGSRPVDEELFRALHTLHGSAQTAEVEAIVALVGPMERILASHREQASALPPEELRLFREALEALEAIAGQLPYLADPAEYSDLQDRLEAWRRHLAEQQPAAEGEDSELLDIFIDEGDELVEACERAVQLWREDPQATDRVMTDLQRNLHTLKGGARMANFPPIADLTHEIESLVNAINDGELSPDHDIFELLQESVDALTVLLEQARSRQGVSRVDWLIDDLRNRRMQGEPTAVASPDAGAAPASDAEAADGGAASAAGDSRGEGEAAPAAEATPGSDQIRVQAELLDNLVNFAGEVSIYHSRLGEHLGQYKFNLTEFEQTVSRLRDQLRDMENETESQILYRHEKDHDSGPVREEFDPLEFDRYTRIQELSRSLAESVGDLDSIKDILDNLTRDAETLLLQQSRVSSDLQGGLMQTRMVRFDGLRARFGRTVRQTARSVGKQVEMSMSGGDIEVDRSIQERMLAPLEHILRNAVSHGVESPEARRRDGKPETGSIRIDLHRGGTDIIIDITDDGAGIDPQVVRRKAIDRGMIAPDDARPDNEIIQLILETGFSTADEVTQVAGRGVGMDVVDAEIRRLGGTLGIKTEKGVGTRFSIRLPVTLAINQAVLVEAGEEVYAIPIASIEGVSQITAGDLREHYVDSSGKVRYGGNEYTLYHLGRLLDVSEPRLEHAEVSYPVVMVRAGDERVALHVDQLVGRREVVVKPLGAPLNTLPGISGATIMADGDVVLILDIGGLLRTEGRVVETGGLGAPAAAQAATDDAAEAGADAGGKAPTILIVDDSITIRKVTQRVLERNGLRVATAKDGVDAVSWMTHSLPDLVLLDIEMPRMDGYEVATYIRGDERLAGVPIIMITSRTGDKHRKRAEDIGVNRYLGKPYQEVELIDAIRELIRMPAVA